MKKFEPIPHDSVVPIEFKVSWTIDVLAHSAEEAAEIALQIQRDPQSMATCFTVVNTKLNTVAEIDVANK